MELIKYNNINGKIFEDFHFKHNTYLNKCINCKETYILKNKDNFIGIYKYKDNIELYFKRFTTNKNLDEMLNYILNHKDFKSIDQIVACISVKNNQLKQIVNTVISNHFGSPQLHHVTLNDNMFKTPKLILVYGCNETHNINKLVDEIKDKLIHHSNDINFSKSDIKFFSELLELPYETGGDIKKLNKDTYEVNKKSIINGEFADIELIPTTYNFHTHPKPVYNERGNLTFAAWFSGVDIRYIVANIPFGLREHFLIAAEGIYKLKPTQDFIKEYKKLNDNTQEKIVNELFELFAKLEDKRVVKKKNVLSINSETIKHFNDFFVIINSLNSSQFKNLKGDYTLFDLEFKFWENFK